MSKIDSSERAKRYTWKQLEHEYHQHVLVGEDILLLSDNHEVLLEIKFRNQTVGQPTLHIKKHTPIPHEYWAMCVRAEEIANEAIKIGVY